MSQLSKVIRYEVCSHNINDMLTHFTVEPIRVVREGVLPGCSAPSITAVDKYGRRFQGSAKDYFDTEDEAWASVAASISESIENVEAQIESLQDNLAQLRYLSTMYANQAANQGGDN